MLVLGSTVERAGGDRVMENNGPHSETRVVPS